LLDLKLGGLPLNILIYNGSWTSLDCAGRWNHRYWFREVSAPEPVPQPVPDADPGPAPAEPPASAVPPAPAPGPGHAPAFEQLTEVEQYAVLYPDRAALIRAKGRLPDRLDFGPPEPEIVEGLVHGTSPILRALDRPPMAVAAE
jgi:hypothetical protein